MPDTMSHKTAAPRVAKVHFRPSQMMHGCMQTIPGTQDTSLRQLVGLLQASNAEELYLVLPGVIASVV